MKKYKLFPYIIFSLFIVSAEIVCAEGSPRDQVVNQALNCFQNNKSLIGDNSEITWRDVCFGEEEQVADEIGEEYIYGSEDSTPNLTTEKDDKIDQALKELNNSEIQEESQATSEKKSLDFELEPVMVTPNSMHGASESKQVSQNNIESYAETVIPTSSEPTRKDTRIEAAFERQAMLRKFEVGVEGYFYNYDEPPDFARLKGDFNGIFGSYTTRLREHKNIEKWQDIWQDEDFFNVVRVDMRYDWAKLDYDSGGTGSDNDIDNYVFEGRASVGYDLPFSNGLLITPFAGLGYRYLMDEQGGRRTTTGHFGYDRESRYFYGLLGFEARIPITRSFYLQPSIEGDLLFYGKQYSHFEDIDPGYRTIKNTQKKGKGYRLSMKLVKEFEKWDFFVEPFARYWKIEDSDIEYIYYYNSIIGTGIEPKNETIESGARVGVDF